MKRKHFFRYLEYVFFEIIIFSKIKCMFYFLCIYCNTQSSNKWHFLIFKKNLQLYTVNLFTFDYIDPKLFYITETQFAFSSLAL